MVYGFARQSKGHVRIASAPGLGTSVTLYLPRAPTDAVPAAEPGEAAMPGGSERILVVEDNDLVREQVVANLAGLGYRVAAARDGIEALTLLRQDPDIRLLFTDVVMPRGMNGRQLAEEALRINPRVAILYASGYSDDTLLRDGRLGDTVQLLAKPYRRRDLAAKVRLVLDRAGTAHTSW
jgi:CheY-like chemotaxis protein